MVLTDRAADANNVSSKFQFYNTVLFTCMLISLQQLQDNFNIETDHYDVELDLAWLDEVCQSKHLGFCTDTGETIDVSDSSEESVSLPDPGHSSLSKIDNIGKNEYVVIDTYQAFDNINSFFGNINNNDVSKKKWSKYNSLDAI